MSDSTINYHQPGSSVSETISSGPTTIDALVIGAGFAGVRMLAELRTLGLSARLLDAGSDVGGTWHWNRYPGARTDSESWVYCLSFSDEIMREWKWKERYPQWDEVNDYLKYVVDKLDLRRDMQFNTRMVSASHDAGDNRWRVVTEAGQVFVCRYLITGLVSGSVVEMELRNNHQL